MGTIRKFKTREQRNKHYRALTKRTDRQARRGKATLERDYQRIEAGPLSADHASRPLASQPVRPQAER